MFAGSLFVATIAALAGLVGATTPGTSDNASNLSIRGNPAQCPAGMTYVGFKQKCKCNDDGHVYGDRDEDFYDKAQKRCCTKPHPKLKCRVGQKQYCVLNVTTWGEYGKLSGPLPIYPRSNSHRLSDQYSELCHDDGITFTFCSRPNDVPKRLAVECFRDKDCPNSGLEHCCKCPKGKVWRNGQCTWKPLEPPKCKDKQVAYCALDTKQFVKYGKYIGPEEVSMGEHGNADLGTQTPGIPSAPTTAYTLPSAPTTSPASPRRSARGSGTRGRSGGTTMARRVVRVPPSPNNQLTSHKCLPRFSEA